MLAFDALQPDVSGHARVWPSLLMAGPWLA